MEIAKKDIKERGSFVIRHREPYWAYINGQRAGTVHLNYVYKNGRRTLRQHIQIKDRKNFKHTVFQVSTIIPLPLISRMMKRIEKDSPINHRSKITFEKKRFRNASP